MKRADGYLYDSEAWHLKKLDEFLLQDFPNCNSITKETADKWCTKRCTEGTSFFNRRITILRQLAIYMTALGVECYIPHSLISYHRPVLTIPSRNEMLEFFSVLDNWETNRQEKKYINAYKIIFRLYYCCGLRLSEAIKLRIRDVDLKNGTMKIYGSKGHKDRIVYLPDDAIETIQSYKDYVSRVYPKSEWMFPGVNPANHMCTSAVSLRFRKCWSKTSCCGKNPKEPTVHCLRHAFVVERINEWAAQGIDLQQMLPYLSRYLGHKTSSETLYYYHMMDSAFQTINIKGIATTAMIPEVIPDEQ